MKPADIIANARACSPTETARCTVDDTADFDSINMDPNPSSRNVANPNNEMPIAIIYRNAGFDIGDCNRSRVGMLLSGSVFFSGVCLLQWS